MPVECQNRGISLRARARGLLAASGRRALSALDVSLGHALSEKLQAALCQVDNLALIVVIAELVIGLDLAVRNLLDHFDDVVGLANESYQSLVLRLEQLQQCPDCDVLERSVAAGKEPAQVPVDAAVGFRPVLDEDGVITDCCSILASDSSRDRHVYKHYLPLDDRLPRAAALLP